MYRHEMNRDDSDCSECFSVERRGLLVLHEPHRIVRKSPGPILVPETDYEQVGFVPNVVFPTGVVERGDRLLLYYGAADTVCAVAELSKADILAAMR